MYGYAIGKARFHTSVLAAIATTDVPKLVYSENAQLCGDYYIGDYTVVTDVDISDATGDLTFTDYGVVRKVEYRKGKLHNEQLWYKNNKIVRVETYKDGEKHGMFSWDDGDNIYQMNYNMGALHGTYIRVGNGITKKMYDNGKLIGGHVVRGRR